MAALWGDSAAAVEEFPDQLPIVRKAVRPLPMQGAQQVCKGALHAPLQCSPVGDQSSKHIVTSKVKVR